MKNVLFYIIMALPVFLNTGCSTSSDSDNAFNLISPPESETDSTITLLWESPEGHNNQYVYQVYQDGKPVATVKKTNYMVRSLLPETTYEFYVLVKNEKTLAIEKTRTISQATKKKSAIFNIVSYGAIGDGVTQNTRAIQKAIDACSPGGTVYIPEGTFLSGALFLKSNMTFYIAKGAVLQGSTDANDYLPIGPSRFAGVERDTYSSLLNAGEIDHSGGYNVTNLSIRGEGTIRGGDQELASAWIEAKGEERRGRLICLRNCENVCLQGLNIEKTPCWTIQFIYSKNITCDGLDIVSTVENGDGLNPDSSTDVYIFNCSFSNGDDCIAIKSGKNPGGYYIARPSENVFISDCKFIEGHSVAIGSEMSGGVRNVLVRDCELGKLNYGLQIKVTKDRGGYVEGVTVRDCDIQKIKIVTSVGYNNEGEPAPELPNIRNIRFSNLDMTKAYTQEPAIFVDGFKGIGNYTRDIHFKDITMAENSIVVLNYCKDFTFTNVMTPNGEKPFYEVTNSKNIDY